MAERKPKKKSRRGFAALSPEQRRAIASQGGKAAHAAGAAHTFTRGRGRSRRPEGWQGITRRRHRPPVHARGGRCRGPEGRPATQAEGGLMVRIVVIAGLAVLVLLGALVALLMIFGRKRDGDD